jgi:putative Mg2+ transporter-C (MgtC) family protein
VVTGVGFLGAGAIIRRDGMTHGLTTAASIWMSSAIGVAVGVRAYTLAAIGTVLALIILEVFRWVEKWMAPEGNAHDEEF